MFLHAQIGSSYGLMWMGTPFLGCQAFLTFNQLFFLCFFFQAEDGIRDRDVTGVQTCALPIWIGAPHVSGVRSAAVATNRSRRRRVQRRLERRPISRDELLAPQPEPRVLRQAEVEIGRASCRERV